MSPSVVVLHHGICHTRKQFQRLIEALNRAGIHVAMVDQQSEDAGWFRNFIGAKSYRKGMAAAVKMIEKDIGKPIGGYALHSMGALIGEETQRKYPHLQRPTVLMAPIPINGALPISLRILWRHPLSFLKAVVTLDVHSLVKTPQQVRELFFNEKTPKEIVNQTTAELKHAPFWIYLQLVFRRLLRPGIKDDGQPKMLLYSNTDEIFHPGEYKNTRARYANLEEHHVSGGHDFFIEYAEQTAKRIAEFFTAEPAEPQQERESPRRPKFLDQPARGDSVEKEVT